MIRAILGSIAALGLSQAAIAETHFTTKCSQFGQQEFQISVSSKAILPADVSWFLATLEGMVAAGEKFKSGETMQIGWMVTKLEAGDRGSLKITEPDMKSLPVKFVDSVDATIRGLRSQKDSVESVLPATALNYPTLTQSVVVHVDYKIAKRILLQRLPAFGADSGWWLSDLTDATGGKDPKRFTKISLFQLAIDRPDLVKFFAFPVGIQVVIDGRVGVLKDGVETRIRPGSFLDQINRNGFVR